MAASSAARRRILFSRSSRESRRIAKRRRIRTARGASEVPIHRPDKSGPGEPPLQVQDEVSTSDLAMMIRKCERKVNARLLRNIFREIQYLSSRKRKVFLRQLAPRLLRSGVLGSE